MNIFSNDNPVLIAPRPVRVTSTPQPFIVGVRIVSDHFDRLKSSEDNENDDPKFTALTDPSVSPDKDLASPRASPRSTLPSEALEEFLSILRPSIFPPTSPILRARRHGAASISTFPYDHPYSYKTRIELISPKSEPTNLPGVEEIERVLSTQPRLHTPQRSPGVLSEREEEAFGDIFDTERRWFTSSTLSSPISRMQTQNPFQRHPSYEMALAGLLPSKPSSPSTYSTSPLSPASVPLPSPTPDEMTDIP